MLTSNVLVILQNACLVNNTEPKNYNNLILNHNRNSGRKKSQFDYSLKSFSPNAHAKTHVPVFQKHAPHDPNPGEKVKDKSDVGYIYTDTMFTSNPNYLNQEYQEVERFSFSHPNGPTISPFFVSPLVFIAPGYSREAN